MVYFLRSAAAAPSNKFGMGELMGKMNWWVVLVVAAVLIAATIALAYAKRPNWLTQDKLDDNGKRKINMMRLSLVCLTEVLIAVMVGMGVAAYE